MVGGSLEMELSALHLLSLFINLSFRISIKLTHGFGSHIIPRGRLLSASSPRPHPFFLSLVRFLWPKMAVLFQSFPKGSSRSWLSFQCRDYLLLPIYYCRMAGQIAGWKINKCFLAVLCSTLLSDPPLQVPFPQYLAISCLFLPCLLSPILFLQFQSQPSPKPHTFFNHIAMSDENSNHSKLTFKS